MGAGKKDPCSASVECREDRSSVPEAVGSNRDLTDCEADVHAAGRSQARIAGKTEYTAGLDGVADLFFMSLKLYHRLAFSEEGGHLFLPSFEKTTPDLFHRVLLLFSSGLF